MDTALAALLVAAAMQESHGHSRAINAREQAFGILQVRQAALTDINRHYHTRYVLTDFLGEEGVAKSLRAFELYGKMYGAKTPEEYARIWNGGPRGMRKRATLAYWRGIQRWMRATAGKTLEEVRDEG